MMLATMFALVAPMADAQAPPMWSEPVPHTMAGSPVTYRSPPVMPATSTRRAQDESQCIAGEFFDSDGTRECTLCPAGYFSPREGGKSRTGLTGGFGNLLIGLPGTPENPAECVYDPCIETCGEDKCSMECYQACNWQSADFNHESGLNGVRTCGAFSQSSIGLHGEPKKCGSSPAPFCIGR